MAVHVVGVYKAADQGRGLTLSKEVPQVYLPPAPPFFVFPVPFLDCEDLHHHKGSETAVASANCHLV